MTAELYFVLRNSFFPLQELLRVFIMGFGRLLQIIFVLLFPYRIHVSATELLCVF
jgi:hypothetical protein